MIPFAVLNSLVSDVKKEPARATARGRSYWETGERGGGGKARFNVATATYADRIHVTAYVLLYNLQTKSIEHYFKRGSTLNLDGFSVKG